MAAKPVRTEPQTQAPKPKGGAAQAAASPVRGRYGDVILGVVVVGILLLMLVPLPPALLDLFLALNLTIALLVLMVAIYVNRPMDFDVFPSVLLFTTLFRLSLNVATTRLILSDGEQGEAAVGLVVTAFGKFVAGGNPVVGGIVFLILVVINFVVITKGAGRIAEVSARFTLDALPGKQLSIDANLNSGLIDEEEARTRRRALEREAEFYGSMDGASKFVRGDAVAGLFITAINIVGGLVIGVVQKNLAFGEAIQIYTILTIGDGLVSQLPALLISTGAGLVVTKVSDGESLGSSMRGPVQRYPRAALMTGGILAALAFAPGLPFLPFIVLAAVATLIGRRVQSQNRVAEKPAAEPPAPAEADIQDLLVVDPVVLEVGYALVTLVDRAREGNLTQRIRAIRRQVAEEMGLVVPPVHIRDNLILKPDEYRILLKGVEIVRAEVKADGFLALNPGTQVAPIEGKPTRDPAFGLPGLWIARQRKGEAEAAGYTVVDPTSAVATHLSVVLKRHAHEIFSLPQMNDLLDRFVKIERRLVEDLIPEPLPRPVLLRVLKNLLKEGVSIRDMGSILEALAEVAPLTKDATLLTERVRQALSRSIVQQHIGENRSLQVITLEKDLESRMLEAASGGAGGANLDPLTLRKLVDRIREGVATAPPNGEIPVLLVPSPIRRPLREAIEPYLPEIAVLAHSEVVPGIHVRSVSTVG